MSTQHPGNVFIVAAPSGAGKSSLINALLKQEPDIQLSISCTTRAPRPGEVDGEHYRFVSVDDFQSLRTDDQLLEWAEVHGNFYGTPVQPIHEALDAGRDVLLEIDWQGARQVRRFFPEAIGVFILPPSIEALESRLNQRGQDSAQVISRRLLAAGSEMSHISEFQYVIINQEFNFALAELAAVVKASRLSLPKQAHKHAELFSQLGIQIEFNS
ncbi:MAG: guanylate kinase [Paenalcaligenes sp.]